MSKRILASAMMAILLAAIVAGCGGGGDSSSSSSGGDETAALSKAEFIEQGDAICAEANKQSQKKAEEFAEDNNFELGKASEDQLEKAVAAVLVPSLTKQAEAITALGAPQGDEEQVEAIVTALEKATTEIEANPRIVFESKVLGRASQLAASYGFKVCGEQ